MRTSARVAALGVTVLALALFPVANASAATYNGTVTGSSGWYHDWSFAGPSASMTGSLSSAQHNSYSSVGQNMKQPDPLDPPGPNFWGGTGDYSSVYAPTDIKDTTGVTVEYQTDTSPGAACAGVTGPTTAGSQTNCGVVDTLTFTFSRPVTDATLQVMNLGGMNAGQSAWAELVNTSGQTLSTPSSGGNFVVNGSTIAPVNVVTGTNLGSNATGSGSVKIAGTYSSVTFDVVLQWYSISNVPAAVVTEGVAFNWTLTDPPPTPPTPPTPPVANGEHVVTAASTSTKLKAGKKKTVVSSAYVTPSSAGSLKSISVTCRPKSKSLAARGDVSYCSYTKNLKTGKVTVTPYRKGLSIKVKVKTKSTDSSYQVESWTKTWTS